MTIKNATFAIAMIAMSTVSGAALAGNSTYGYTTGANNDMTITSDGDCNYTSADQDGYWLRGKFYTRGIRNNQVIGQSGYGSITETNLRGYRNVLGIAQNANRAYVGADIRGSDNGVAVYQNRSGSYFSGSVNGRNNTVVYRD